MSDAIRSLGPYVVLLASIAALVFGRLDGPSAQLLSTIVGVIGGVMMPRRADGTTTTVTAGDPPTVTTEPKS